MESHIIGHPRVDTKREPKFSLESLRYRTSSAEESLKAATDLESSVRKKMAYINSGIPTTAFVGAVPPAMEMTKRFDTHYHLIALDVGPDGKSIHHKAVAEYKGDKAIHIHMCVNDFSNTILSIMAAVEDKITINEKVLPVYREGVKNDAGIGVSPKISYPTPTSTTISSNHLHIHSRYSNSNSIIDSTIDANVITIENSRPDEKLPRSAVLEGVKYGAGIGPGVYDVRSLCASATPTSTTSSALLHIHMGYDNSNLDDIIDSIMDMDADVIIIDKSSRHDIHSQSMLSTEVIADRINKKLAKYEANIFWVNPDCGLLTRKNTKVKPSLENMVAAAKLLRSSAPSLPVLSESFK